MQMEQLTIDSFLIDYPCKKDNKKECFYSSCCEATRCECCAGCESANKCTSRCVRSYKFICYEQGLIDRHIENGLPILKHNQGTILLSEGGKAYAIVMEAE